jgi:hypothetical protein
MTIPLEYSFLTGALLSLLLWSIFFALSKGMRKDMVWISLFVGVYALVCDYFWWNVDWWHPITVTGTRIGIEDFITGFSCGGIMAVVAPFLLSKKIKKEKSSYRIMGALLLIGLQFFCLAVFTNWLGFPSVYGTVIGYLLTTPMLLLQRRDLWPISLTTAVATSLGTLPIYGALQFLFPDYVAKTWIFSNLSGILFLGIPIEDVLFFFLLALFFGPFYWYLTNKTFVTKQ